MKIEKNKVVLVTYDLTVDGALADQATQENPLDYIHGTHMLIPAFEEAVEGLSEGESFAFTLSPEQGYGPYDPAQRKELPKSIFVIDGTLREDLLQRGRIIPLIGGDGQVVNAIVDEIGEQTVTMDFNHPMAGKALRFEGKVLSVRDATENELTEGLHGEFLPPEEGCCHGKGHCHHHHEDGEEHECCHGKGHGKGHCCHHHDEEQTS